MNARRFDSFQIAAIMRSKLLSEITQESYQTSLNDSPAMLSAGMTELFHYFGAIQVLRNAIFLEI